MESTRIEYPDKVEWSNKQGKYHREDGPAREWSDGSKEWYLNGKDYSEQEYNDEILKIRLRRLMEL